MALSGSDACQGDSGGPLLQWFGSGQQRAFLVGVISRGDGCGQKNKAGTDVMILKNIFAQNLAKIGVFAWAG
jgi:secreted trypsin-like serine protease